jgi:heat shock protein HslJ
MIGAIALVTLLAGCGGSTTVVAGGDGGDGGNGGSKPSVQDRPTGEWRTTSIEQAPTVKGPGVKPDAFTLRFFDDGRVIAQARCNSISGNYRIADGKFRMDEAATTEMGCPGDNRHEEDTWLAAFLTSGPAWSFDGKRIGLDGPEIDVELAPREEVVPNTPIVGTTWKVTHLTDGPAPGAPADPNSSVSAGAPMGTWELTFTATEVRGRGQCATFTGPAEQRDGAIRFGSITKDLSKCSDGDPGMEALLAVLAGDVTVKQHIETLTLTHSSGKGLQLSAADEPGSTDD